MSHASRKFSLSNPSRSINARYDPWAGGQGSELKEYAQAYFKYTKLFQDQADAMCHDPQKMNAAHARITEENLAVKKRTPVTAMTAELAQEMMAEYTRRCEDEPRTFDELSTNTLAYENQYSQEYCSRIRISFVASFYVQAMLHIVLQTPDRPRSDFQTVIARGAQLL